MPELYTPQLFYLRWMELLLGERFEELKDLRKIAADMWERSMQEERTREEWLEVLMNTAYADPEISAGKWMGMLDRGVRQGEEIRLYFMLGESVSYLGGIKDLSELFACGKKVREFPLCGKFPFKAGCALFPGGAAGRVPCFSKCRAEKPARLKRKRRHAAACRLCIGNPPRGQAVFKRQVSSCADRRCAIFRSCSAGR